MTVTITTHNTLVSPKPAPCHGMGVQQSYLDDKSKSKHLRLVLRTPAEVTPSSLLSISTLSVPISGTNNCIVVE
jgi:hypothetical protein